MKKYVFRLLGIFLLAMFGTMACNYIFDSSGVFNTDFSVKRVEPNQHFVKMRYILSNPEKYNAFCFGSSRIGNIDLNKIDNGLRYYNMTYSEGLPEEWLLDLQDMVKYGVSIKQVMIGLDDFSIRVDPKQHENDLLRVPYRDDTLWKTYALYLLKKPKLKKEDASRGSVYDIYGSGRPLHPEVDEYIEANVEKHLQDERFSKPYEYKGNRIAETMESLTKLKELCDDNGIELLVFVNPVNAVTYRSNDISELNEFKYQLAQLTNYYDFSGLNEITTNNYYYYETSHYRPMVGDMIVDRIFHNGQRNFGVIVTKDNVKEHLQKLEEELDIKGSIE